MSGKTIPTAVRDLLAYYWNTDIKYSAFEHVWKSKGDTHDYVMDRRIDASYYMYRPGDIHDNEFTLFDYTDAVALTKDGVFRNLYHTRKGSETIAINEHAQHAFRDFMVATYAAWEIYQSRLDEIERYDRSKEYLHADEKAND